MLILVPEHTIIKMQRSTNPFSYDICTFSWHFFRKSDDKYQTDKLGIQGAKWHIVMLCKFNI